MNKKNKQTIGIIGFGRFGTLISSILNKDFAVKVFHYKNNDEIKDRAKKVGIKLCSLEDTLNSDFVILAVPISKTEETIKQITNLIKPGTVVIDTCSVKIYPSEWLHKYLPDNVEILPTHPMFGPTSTKYNFEKQTWKLDGLQIVLCPGKIDKNIYEDIKKYLRSLKLEIIETTPEDHDEQNVKTLAMVHFLGRSLWEAGFREQKIFTPGYERLISIFEHTTNDDWQLFFDMNNYNPNVEKIKNSFFNACDYVEDKIIQSNSKDDFDYRRKKINEIDKRIFKLLELRIQQSQAIGEYKKQNNLPILDKKREEEIIKTRTDQSMLDKDFIKNLYELIFKESRKSQE